MTRFIQRGAAENAEGTRRTKNEHQFPATSLRYNDTHCARSGESRLKGLLRVFLRVLRASALNQQPLPNFNAN